MSILKRAAFAYGLHEATFEISRPGLVAIVGPNGAGKSTLVSIMAGLRQPYRGSVMFDGREVSRWRKRDFARRVAFLPQNPMALLHRATVAAEVAWTVRGDPPSGDAHTIIADLVRLVVQQDLRGLADSIRLRNCRSESPTSASGFLDCVSLTKQHPGLNCVGQY